jgi:hypothetical protein
MLLAGARFSMRCAALPLIPAGGLRRFRWGLSLSVTQYVVAGFPKHSPKLVVADAHGEADDFVRLQEHARAAQQLPHARGQGSNPGHALLVLSHVALCTLFRGKALTKAADCLAKHSQRTGEFCCRRIQETFRHEPLKPASEVILIHSSVLAGALTTVWKARLFCSVSQAKAIRKENLVNFRTQSLMIHVAPLTCNYEGFARELEVLPILIGYLSLQATAFK